MPCPACTQDAILHHSTYRFWELNCPNCDLSGAGNTAMAACDALLKQASQRDTKRLTKS